MEIKTTIEVGGLDRQAAMKGDYELSGKKWVAVDDMIHEIKECLSDVSKGVNPMMVLTSLRRELEGLSEKQTKVK